LNSPETPLFSKGKLLYGLFQAKGHVLAGRRAMILEGYMDVVGAHQGGFPFAVATLGTALTRDHAKLIKRYAEEIISFFDPDEAGRKAALRGFEPLVQEELFPRVVMSGDDLDPDELFLQKGPERLTALIQEAPDFVDYILKTSLRSNLNIKEKSDLAGQLLAIIAQSPNGILKSEWTRRVGQALGLQEDVLTRELAKVRTSPEALVKKPVSVPAKRTSRPMPTIEEEFLQLVMGSPAFLAECPLRVDDFQEERSRRLYAHLAREWADKGRVTGPSIIADMPESDTSWLLDVIMEERVMEDPAERYHQLVRDIQLRRDQKKLTALSQNLAQGVGNADLMTEYKELLKRVKGSGRI